MRSCPNCEAPIDEPIAVGSACPECGLDPALPRLAFEDAPAFFLAGDPRLEPILIAIDATPPQVRRTP